IRPDRHHGVAARRPTFRLPGGPRGRRGCTPPYGGVETMAADPRRRALRHCLVPRAKTNVERDRLHLTTPGEAGSGGTSYSGRHDRGVEMSESKATSGGVARRSILRIGAIGTAGLAFGAVQ